MKDVIFRAGIYRISTDREGESKIILEVSKKFLAKAVTLNAMLEKELEVKINIAKGKEI